MYKIGAGVFVEETCYDEIAAAISVSDVSIGVGSQSSTSKVALLSSAAPFAESCWTQAVTRYWSDAQRI